MFSVDHSNIGVYLHPLYSTYWNRLASRVSCTLNNVHAPVKPLALKRSLILERNVCHCGVQIILWLIISLLWENWGLPTYLWVIAVQKVASPTKYWNLLMLGLDWQFSVHFPAAERLTPSLTYTNALTNIQDRQNFPWM